MAKRTIPRSRKYESEDRLRISDEKFHQDTEFVLSHLREMEELKRIERNLGYYREQLPGHIETLASISNSLKFLRRSTRIDRVNQGDRYSGADLNYIKTNLTNAIAALSFFEDGLITEGKSSKMNQDKFKDLNITIQKLGTYGQGMFASGAGFREGGSTGHLDVDATLKEMEKVVRESKKESRSRQRLYRRGLTPPKLNMREFNENNLNLAKDILNQGRILIELGETASIFSEQERVNEIIYNLENGIFEEKESVGRRASGSVTQVRGTRVNAIRDRTGSRSSTTRSTSESKAPGQYAVDKRVGRDRGSRAYGKDTRVRTDKKGGKAGGSGGTGGSGGKGGQLGPGGQQSGTPGMGGKWGKSGKGGKWTPVKRVRKKSSQRQIGSKEKFLHLFNTGKITKEQYDILESERKKDLSLKRSRAGKLGFLASRATREARAKAKSELEKLNEGDGEFPSEFEEGFDEATDEAIYEMEEYPTSEPDKIAQHIISKMMQGNFLSEINMSASKIATSLFSSTKEALSAVGEIDSNAIPVLEDFSDIFELSTASVIGTLSLVNYGLAISASAVSGMLGSVSKIIKLVSGDSSDSSDNYDKEDSDSKDELSKDEGESGAMKKSTKTILKTILGITSSILQAIAMGFQAIATVITLGTSLLVGVLKNTLSLLKKIASTSPLMDQILNIVNLSLIMFFIPFSNQFANQLLEQVYNFVIQARDTGDVLGDSFYMIIDNTKELSVFLSAIIEELTRIGLTFMKEVLPLMLSVFPLLITVALYFTKTLMDNKEALFKLINKGIEASTEFLNNNILYVFLSFGTAAMKFLYKNADGILNVMEMCVSITEKALGLTIFVMEHFREFCVILGGTILSLISIAIVGIGSAKGVIEALSKGGGRLVAQLFGRGFLKAGALGFGVGAALGYSLWYLLFDFGEYAEGGYIPPTSTGTYALVAERETEYIVPQSKISMIRGHNNLVIDFDKMVIGVDNFKNEIYSVLNDSSLKSAYR